LNKFGGVSFNPSVDDAFFHGDTGFAEIWIGPKFTFLRSESTCTLGAFGLTFQIPVGSHQVYQDTGELSLVPYVSMGQAVRLFDYGSLNLLGTLGYAFDTDNMRSEHFFLSAHVDFDIANTHRFYPLIELNWFHYAQNGTSNPFGFEGADIANFGSRFVSGN